LNPLLEACATKNPKLTLIALGGLQKLIQIESVPPRFLSAVIGTLRIQAESASDQVQLKILQTLLLAISPSSVETHPTVLTGGTKELLQGSLLQALGICLRLHGMKNPSIRNTAFAALRQMVTLLFDRVSKLYKLEWKSLSGEDKIKVHRLTEGNSTLYPIAKTSPPGIHSTSEFPTSQDFEKEISKKLVSLEKSAKVFDYGGGLKITATSITSS